MEVVQSELAAAPASVTSTAPMEFAMEVESGEIDPGARLKETLLLACKQDLDSFGTPSAYLTSRLKEQTDAETFLAFLWDQFPERDDVFYTFTKTMAKIEISELSNVPPLALPLGAFGFTQEASLKPPCGTSLAMQLLEHYLEDGFVTAGEPLLIQQSSDGVSPFETLALHEAALVRG